MDAKTRKSYQKIAPTYVLANQQRDSVKADMNRFMAWLPAGGQVVDLGCGPGFDTAVFHQHSFQAIGIDLSWEMLRAGPAQFSIALVQADFRQLPLAQVDGVWACASLVHLPHDAMLPALHEIARVLRPGGLLYLSLKWGTGAAWQPTSYDQAAPRFFAYWTPDTLDPLLHHAGFTILPLTSQPDNPPWLIRFATNQPLN